MYPLPSMRCRRCARGFAISFGEGAGAILTSGDGVIGSAPEFYFRHQRLTRLHDRSREPEQTVRRPRGGPGPLLHGTSGRDSRLPRPERRRQDHHPARHHGVPPRHLGHGTRVRLRRLRAVRRGPPAHRLSAREPAPLQRHDGGAVPPLRGPDPRRRARWRRRGGRSGGRHLRAQWRHRAPARASLEGLPATRRPGTGADSRPRGADSRRAHQWARSGPDPRHARLHPIPGGEAHHRALDPHPVAGAERLPEGRHHQRRPHRPGGAPGRPDTRPLAGGRLHAGHLRRRVAAPPRGRGVRLMRNVLTIAGREIRSYFSSPVAYVLLAAFLALAGYFFYALLTAFNQTLAIYSMMRNPEMLQRFNLNEMVIRPLLHNMAVLLIFIVPAITMRMFPEEKRSGTYELLLTSPVRVGQIAAGKFLGGLVLVLLMIALSGVFGLLLSVYGNPEIRMMLSGYLGLLLMAATFLAIGTLI